MKKILLFLLAGFNLAISQTIVFKPFETNVVKGTDEHLKNYNLLQFDVRELVNQIDQNTKNYKEITLRTPTRSWQLVLFEYNLTNDWVRTSGDPNKPTRLPVRKDLRTFNGYIKGINSLVSMTIADNGFLKLMIDDRQERYFIEPLDPESKSKDIPENQQFLAYKASDVNPVKGIKCGVDYVNKAIEDGHKQISSRAAPCKQCVIVKICLAADNTMWRKYGGSIANTENQMISILADVQTVFDDEFEHEYQYDLTGTFVADVPATDPWNGINDINSELTRFNLVAPQVFFASQYNVATCWSAKWSTGVIGLAYLATVCMNDRYNVCSDFLAPGGRQGMYLTLQAHELGHNWSCIHDAGIAQTIMAPTINGSTTWSTLSTSYLNNYVNFQHLIESMCLSVCPNSDAPQPAFTSDITYGCQPVTVHFKDQSLYTTSWSWSFPGGSPATSTLQNPTVIYRTPGKYEVSLEAGNSRCKVSTTQIDYIEVNDVPFADFSFGIDGKTVYFINQSLRGTDYLWKFGNGDQSEDEMPSYEYDRDSTYEVTLRVTNDCGVRTVKKKVTIVSIPNPDFDADTTGGCAPKIIKFIDKSTNNVIHWEWKFPGGNPSSSLQQNPFVRYDNPGVYDAELTVYSTKYNRRLTKKLYITIDSLPKADFSYSVANNTVSFSSQSRYSKSNFWDFGDNTTSTQANPDHTYLEGRYEVVYVATNACGNDTAKTIITVGAKPIAGFQVDDQQGCLPYQVQFTNTSTAAATAFRWYFPGGNPSTSTAKNPLVTYNSVGKFDVSLFAYNNFFSDSIGLKEFIEVKTEPTASFSNVISGFKSIFTNQASGASNYFWDFGDQTSSFEKDPVHDYGVEGEFDVRLIVQNECGLDTFDKHIAVYLVPKVNYRVDSVRGCAPLKVKFFDKSSSDVTDWEWQFEGGNPLTSTDKNPEVVFTKKGRYTVKLTVKNTNGTNALTRQQYIQVLSTVYCPEHTKTKRFAFSTDPFGTIITDRSNDIDTEQPFIYPNPAQDHIYIYTGAKIGENTSIEMFDLSGRKLSNYITNETLFKIQTEQLRAGAYYLKLMNGSNNSILKFVIAE